MPARYEGSAVIGVPSTEKHGTCDRCKSPCNMNLVRSSIGWVCKRCSIPTWTFKMTDDYASSTGVESFEVRAGVDWFADALGTLVHYLGMDAPQNVESVVDPQGNPCVLQITEDLRMVPVRF